MGNTGTPAPFSIVGKLGSLAIGAAGGDATGFLAAVAVASGVSLLAALGWVLVHFADRPLAALEAYERVLVLEPQFTWIDRIAPVRIEHGKGGRHRGIRLMMIRDDHIHAEFFRDRNFMM